MKNNDRNILAALHCPFPGNIHPLVNEVQAYNIKWIDQFGFIEKDKLLTYCNKYKYGWMAARVYWPSDLNTLCLACDFLAWLHFADDQFEHIAGNRSMHIEIVTAILQVLDNETIPPDKSSPLIISLMDFHKRIEMHTSERDWKKRFTVNLKNAITTTIWEADNRLKKEKPSLADYLEKRPYAGAIYPSFDFLEITTGCYLPDAVYYHEAVQQLLLHCVNAITWINDIISYEMELATNEPHNLLILLENEQQLSHAEALNAAVSMYNDCIHHFRETAGIIPSFGVETDAALQTYIKGLQSWISGYLDWCVYDTGRFSS